MTAIRAAYKLPAAESPVGFRKHRLDAAFRSEGVAVADFNGDHKLDIAAGNVYYAGPDWKMVPMLGEAKSFNRFGYSDAFLCYADDLNGDGKTDLIVVGFPGQETRWLENPGVAGSVWKSHPAIAKTGNENPAYIDMDGDGRRELVFMNDGKCAFAQPGEDPTQPWKVRVIANPGDPSAAHGLGIGDVNRDGRLDVLIPDGWWQGPATPASSPWTFHAAKFFGGAQLCVVDIDGDGDNDVLGSSAHGYGISWCEQTPEGWITHEIDNTYSQTHAIVVADINGDGLPDFRHRQAILGPQRARCRLVPAVRVVLVRAEATRGQSRSGRDTSSTPRAASACSSRSSMSTEMANSISSPPTRTASSTSSRSPLIRMRLTDVTR